MYYYEYCYYIVKEKVIFVDVKLISFITISLQFYNRMKI